MTDRERDALVAEKVMGWVKVPTEDGPPGSWRWLLPNGVKLVDSEYWPEHYSKNRNAAALVLERIGDLGLCPQFDAVIREWYPVGTRWSLLMIPPAQLMDAALACVAGKEPAK